MVHLCFLCGEGFEFVQALLVAPEGLLLESVVGRYGVHVCLKGVGLRFMLHVCHGKAPACFGEDSKRTRVGLEESVGDLLEAAVAIIRDGLLLEELKGAVSGFGVRGQGLGDEVRTRWLGSGVGAWDVGFSQVSLRP